MFFAFVAVGLQWWNPPGLLSFLMNAVGGCLIVTWIMITLSYIRLRPEMRAGEGHSAVEVQGGMFVPWATLAALLALVGLMLIDASARGQILAVLIVSAALVVASLFTRGRAAALRQDDLS